MSYLVTAPCVVARDQDGRLHHVYEGGVIQWLSPEQAKHFLDSELVEETGKGVGGSDPAADEPEADEEEAGPSRPASNASKPDLIEWVVANLAKDDGSDYTAEELDELTKAKLWELIDAADEEG